MKVFQTLNLLILPVCSSALNLMPAQDISFAARLAYQNSLRLHIKAPLNDSKDITDTMSRIAVQEQHLQGLRQENAILQQENENADLQQEKTGLQLKNLLLDLEDEKTGLQLKNLLHDVNNGLTQPLTGQGSSKMHFDLKNRLQTEVETQAPVQNQYDENIRILKLQLADARKEAHEMAKRRKEAHHREAAHRVVTMMQRVEQQENQNPLVKQQMAVLQWKLNTIESKRLAELQSHEQTINYLKSKVDAGKSLNFSCPDNQKQPRTLSKQTWQA